MALSFVTLVLDMTDGAGNQLNRGMAVLAPSVFLTGSGGNPDVPQAPVGAQFAGSTFPQVSLLATDNQGLGPAGWGWGISFTVVPGNPSPWSFFLPAGPASFTATDASPAVFTFTPTSALTSLPDSTGIQLSGGSLPGGFTAGVTYYVVNASGYTFELAATVNGTPLASSSTGPGSLTVTQYYLSSLSPVSPVTTMAAYMPLPSGTPAPGDVPAYVGPGTQWESGGGGSGTVTSVAVESANGLTGTVADSTTTPQLTLGTTVTGLLKGSGAAISAAAAGTDYLAPAGSGAALTGITAAQVGADASGLAAQAQSNAEAYAASQASTAQANAETYAAGQVSAETTRAEAAEAGLVSLTANQSISGTKAFTGEVTVPTPVNSGDAVPKSYADGISAGLSIKASCQESTAGALPSNTYSNGSSGVGATLTATANGALTADGITVALNDRVLVQNEATASHNGIYQVTATGSGSAPYVLTRTADMDAGSQLPGAFTFVEQGTANAGCGYVIASEGPFTVGTTAVNWTKFSSLPVPVPIADGGTSATTATGALSALGAAPLASPALTGSPTAPTPAASDNSTNLATTAYVQAVFGGALPTLTVVQGITGSANLAVNTHNEVSAASGSNTQTLPASVAGALIVVEKTDAAASPPGSGNNVAVTGNIRGSSGATITLELQNESELFFGYAGSWWPIAGHKTLSSLQALFLQAASNLSDLGSRQTALNNLAGSVPSGQFLRGNGTSVVMSAIQAADVPVLNQSTTGTAGGLSSALAIGSGGTGHTTAAAAYNALNPNAAPAVTTPSNPAGTTSASLVMCGIGALYTPASSGLVLVVITGQSATSTSGSNVGAGGRYGLNGSTTVASGSNGGEISTIASWGATYGGNGVLAVASVAGFATSGQLLVAASGSTTAVVTYTGVSGNTYTGCAYVSGSATGTVATGNTVVALPVNGNPVTGTRFGSGADLVLKSTGATTDTYQFALTDLLTLNAGSQYWFDLAQSSSLGSVTTTLLDIKIVLVELPAG